MVVLNKLEKRRSLCFFLPLYFIFARYLLSFLFALIIYVGDINLSADMIDAWFNLFYDSILTVIGILCFRQFLLKNIEQMKGRWLKTLGWSLFIGLPLLYVTNIVSSLLITLISPESSSSNQDVIILMTQIAPVQMVISSVVLAPILEELVFRAGIFSLLYERHRGLAYLLSSLAFGFIHIFSGLMAGDLSQLLYLFPYSLLGAVFCYIYEKKESIFAPMLIHAANNFISMAAILLL